MSGIDGIGKRGGNTLAQPDAAVGTGNTGKTGEPATSFREVSAGSRANAPSAAEAPAQVNDASALEQLRAGNVDVNGYLDLKVDEATRSLAGLPKSELDAIRQALRAQLSSDPGLADLVQKATGAMPPVRVGEGE